MNKFFDKIFSMKIAVLVLLIFAFFAGLATIIESVYDTASAWAKVYGATYFGALQVYLGLNLAYNIYKFKLYQNKSLPSFLFHFSFILILLGAILTRFFGFEAGLHLRENETSNVVYSKEEFLQFSTFLGDEKISNDSKKIFSKIGGNYFKNELVLGDKKAVLTYKNLIEDAKISWGEVENGEAILGLIFSDSQFKRDVVLQNGDEITIGDLSVSFNSEPKSENFIKFHIKNKEFFINTNQDITYLQMSDMSEHNLTKNADFRLDKPYLFNINGINFAVSTSLISGGEKVTSDEKTAKGERAIIAELEYNGEKKDVYAFLGYNPRDFVVGGQNFTIGWTRKNFTLPFDVKLNDFIMDRYPGSNSPSGYKSVIEIIENGEKTLDYEIYMNHVLDFRGFRFFQESYDQDELGTVLSINQDPGKMPTYFGYFLLSLGLFLNIFNPNSRFRKLSKLIDESTNKSAKMFAIIVMAGFLAVPNLRAEIYTLSDNHAQKLSALLVQGFDGRTQPLDTMSRDLLNKIYGKTSYEINGKKLIPSEVVLSIALSPSEWQNLPLIKIKNDELKQLIGLEKSVKFAKFNDFYDKDKDNKIIYKIQKHVELANRKPMGNRSMLDKELLKVDERVNILNMAFYGEFLKFIPKQNDPNNTWLSPIAVGYYLKGEELEAVNGLLGAYFTSVMEASQSRDFSKADRVLELVKKYQEKVGSEVIISDTKTAFELKFNQLSIFKKLILVYILAGFLLLIAVFVRIQKPKLNINFLFKTIYSINVLAFIAHTIGIAVRWYISGHAPWSNAYESLVYIAWSLSLSGMIFSRRSPLSLALTSILAGITLFVANLSGIDPQITNIMPVLNSYWLTIHVSVITASYGFLGLCALLGLFTLVLFAFINDKNKTKLEHNITEASRINEMAMILGLSLLTVGNFLGGVWANESWGRYWGWDSKETWALVTILVYAAVLHARFIAKFNSQYWFAVFSMFAYLSVIMTYFGVNFYLTGMHSYAAGEAIPVPRGLYISLFVMIALSVVGFFKRKFSKRL